MPKIYVACLAAYNAGRLHGSWIDCSLGVDHIEAEVASMLASSPVAGAEEWAIHEYEFDGIKISEYESFDTCADLAEALEDHGEAFAIYWNCETRDSVADAISAFQDRYQGSWSSVADYVEDYWDQCGEFSPSDNWWHPSNYVDWDRMAHDLEVSGDIWSECGDDGFVHIFSNC